MNCLWVHNNAKEMRCLGIATTAVVRRDGRVWGHVVKLSWEVQHLGNYTNIYRGLVTSCPGNNWSWIPMLNFPILGEMHQACSSHRVQGRFFFLHLCRMYCRRLQFNRASMHICIIAFSFCCSLQERLMLIQSRFKKKIHFLKLLEALRHAVGQS